MRVLYCIPGRVVVLVQDNDGDGNDDDIVQTLLHLVLDHHRESGQKYVIYLFLDLYKGFQAIEEVSIPPKRTSWHFQTKNYPSLVSYF